MLSHVVEEASSAARTFPSATPAWSKRADAPVYHAIYQISIRDTVGRFGEVLEVLSVPLGTLGGTDARGIGLNVVFLYFSDNPT